MLKRTCTREPGFLIAGGVASGTSFLSTVLAQHPDLYLPREQRPEPNFFHYSWKYGKGVDWYLDHWFADVKAQKAIGERSSLYLNSAVAPERIHATFPRIKLIFCLRNPIERAWANYRFTCLEGLEPLDFDAALVRESDRMRDASDIWAEVQPHAYATRSHYATHLRRYFSLFGKSNVLLVKSEDLGKNTVHNVARVCEYLGIARLENFDMPPNFTSPSVRDPVLQTELRQHFGGRFSELVEHVRTGISLPQGLSHPDDLARIEMLRNNLRREKSPMPSGARGRLRAQLRAELEELKNLVDFPIDDWLTA